MAERFLFSFCSNWPGRSLAEGGSESLLLPLLVATGWGGAAGGPRTLFLIWAWVAWSRKIWACLHRASSALAVLKGKSCETPPTWVRMRHHHCPLRVHGRVLTVQSQGGQDEGHLIDMDCQGQKGDILPPNPPHPCGWFFSLKNKLTVPGDLKCRWEIFWEKLERRHPHFGMEKKENR